MDLFQLSLGIIFLIIGSLASFNTSDTKRVILGIASIIIGLALSFVGFGFKI